MYSPLLAGISGETASAVRTPSGCGIRNSFGVFGEQKELRKMLLKNYELRIVLSDCNPSSQKVNAIADLSEDISEVLPYLNTVLKGLQYYGQEKILTVKKGGRLITFRPRQIAVTKLEDENEARAVVEELKQILNETYAHKDWIKPTHTSRLIPGPLYVFKLLPGKNCKECGEATCMAFALKLINDEVELKNCPLLFTKEFETNYLKLMEGVNPNG
jgi:ArsR family metal-binding transcriptional regulator